MTIVSFKLPKKLAAKLERVAKAERRPRQALLREAVERRLNTNPTASPGSVYDKIKHIIGSVEGPADLATNPDYMKGFGE